MFTGHPHHLAELARQHRTQLARDADHTRLRRELRRRRKT
jgi:hypothetical protein